MKKLILLSIGSIILLFSCGKNEVETPDPSIYGYDYFPLEVGNEWIYKVDSVLIIQGGLANKFSSSYIKEEITELIEVDGSERTYRLERSNAPTLTEPWKLRDVWTISIDQERAYRTEENLKFIKLVFPAVAGKRWDGNVFFDSEREFDVASSDVQIYLNWDYRIESLGNMKTYNEMDYTDVLHVSHIDEVGYISKKFSEEFYAKGVGLVERKMEIFETQNGNENLPWLERAEEGFMLTQTLHSFKK